MLFRSGKTTLAAQVASEHDTVTRFDLEDPRDLARLEDPSFALRPLTGLVILDEIQRRPDLFPLLRVLADREPLPARFLILGSASPHLLRQSSETLAGRIEFHRVDGFELSEVGDLDRRWLRGGLPRPYLADSDEDSMELRAQFVTTFLERDLPQLGIGVAAPTMRRFWTMLAHWHGQLWNGAELGRSLGVSAKTVRAYLDHLANTFVVRQLQPWHANLKKRQVKSPRLYITDSGLLHALLDLGTREALLRSPKCGASFEGFAMRTVLAHLGARESEAWFWRTHDGAELDLLVQRAPRRVGFEFKLTDAPRRTRSMARAIEDLELDELVIVHAGEDSHGLSAQIRAVALSRISEEIAPL